MYNSSTYKALAQHNITQTETDDQQAHQHDTQDWIVTLTACPHGTHQPRPAELYAMAQSLANADQNQETPGYLLQQTQTSVA